MFSDTEVFKELHTEKNNMELMNLLGKGSHTKAWFVCKKGCGQHEWETCVRNRFKRNGCPICSNKKICKCGCNSLKTKFPDIAEEWHFDLNDKTPDEYRHGSRAAVWWICKKSKCGTVHKWKTKISHRTTWSKTGCPVCSNKKICDCCCNSLKNEFPEIVEMWNYDENKRLPEEFTLKSNEKIWWKCKKSVCGITHKWQTTICNITGGGRCPYCVNKKICPCCCNSLKSRFPEVADEWHDKNQKNPKDFLYGSHQKVYWKCTNCEHEWKTTINSRTSYKSCCPRCKSSKGEKYVTRILSTMRVPFHVQKTFDDCRDKNLLRFDFYLTDLHACIEFDGIQHFEPVKFFGGLKGFKNRQRRDKIKNKYCEDKKIPLLRIKYDNKYIAAEIHKFIYELGN